MLGRAGLMHKLFASHLGPLPLPSPLTQSPRGADRLTLMGTCQPPALGAPAPRAGVGLVRNTRTFSVRHPRASPTAGVSAPPLLT